MQDRFVTFRSSRRREEAGNPGLNALAFEDRLARLKKGKSGEALTASERDVEPGFPDSLIRHQISRLLDYYASRPELSKLGADARTTEIRRNLYCFWDEAAAKLPDQPQLKAWVRSRIDRELS